MMRVRVGERDPGEQLPRLFSGQASQDHAWEVPTIERSLRPRAEKFAAARP